MTSFIEILKEEYNALEHEAEPQVDQQIDENQKRLDESFSGGFRKTTKVASIIGAAIGYMGSLISGTFLITSGLGLTTLTAGAGFPLVAVTSVSILWTSLVAYRTADTFGDKKVADIIKSNVKSLERVVTKRDSVILDMINAEERDDDNEIKKLKSKYESLTKKQKKIGADIATVLADNADMEALKRIMPQKELARVSAIIDSAAKGKLTNLEKIAKEKVT